MGCTNSKTGNPNKNIDNKGKAQPLTQSNPQTPTNHKQNLNSNNFNSKIGQQNQNYQTSNHQSNVYNGNQSFNNQSPGMNQPSAIYQPSNTNQYPVNQSGYKESGYSSPISHLNTVQKQGSLGYSSTIKRNDQNGVKSNHESGFKPNQYQYIDTTDDEIVNQQKTMNFDLGIKFSMQIEVQ